MHRLPLSIPVYRHTTRRPGSLYVGLLLYRLLGSRSGFKRIDWRRWDNPDGLETRDLQAVFQFQEAQTDDAALTRAVLNSALDLGARLECPATVTEIECLSDGWRVGVRQGEQTRNWRSATLVNAAGPWVNKVLRSVVPPVADLPLDLVQGAHLVLPGVLRAGGYYCEAVRDRRAVFLLPWQEGKTLVGTTETPFAGDPDQARTLPSEVDYLLDTVERYFPAHGLAVQTDFAGLRVLPRGPSTPFGRSRGQS